MDWNATWKIYWTKLDGDKREIIERGVHPKEYKNYGNAWNAADKKYPYREGYRYIIAQRSPWEDWYEDVECPICGKTHRVWEHYTGYRSDSSIWIRDFRPRVSGGRVEHEDYNNVCPECYDQIRGFISTLKEKKDEKTI